ESRARAERWRIPVGAALVSWPRRHARRLRRLNGAAVFVEAARPVHLYEVVAEQEFSGGAIDHVEVAVAVRPHHHFPRRTLAGDVSEYRHLHRVVVVAVVRRELEMPLQPAGIRVECDDAVRVKVVAGALTRIPVRAGIADTPVREILFR